MKDTCINACDGYKFSPLHTVHICTGLFILFLAIFIIILIINRNKNKLKINRILHRYPVIITFLFATIIVLLASFENSSKSFFSNSSIIGILSIIGIIGTIIGVVLTYEQLKIAEDRIDGYEKFYNELFYLLKDKKAKTFQFYGPTFIPGQIAYNDKKDLDEYFYLLTKYIHERAEFKVKSEIIVPSKEIYKEAYKPYQDGVFGDKKYTDNEINDLLNEVDRYQFIIKNHNGVILEITDSLLLETFDNFYFSNGNTVIYAIPLHFQVALATEEQNNPLSATSSNTRLHKKSQTELIGFKTKDRSVIKAFESKFHELKKTIK